MAIGERILNFVTGGTYAENVHLRRQVESFLEDKRELLELVSEAHTTRPMSVSQQFGAMRTALDYRVSSALSTIYTKVRATRTELIRAVDEVRNYYIACAIIDQIAEDALSPDVATDEIVTVKSNNKAVQAKLTELDERFGFDLLVNDIKRDLLYYGEYTLRLVVDGPGKPEKQEPVPQNPQSNVRYLTDPNTGVTTDQVTGRAVLVPTDPGQLSPEQPQEPPKAAAKGNGKKPKGIVEIRDDVEQERVIAITQNGEVTSYLSVQDQSQHSTRVELVEPSKFVKFVLNHAKLRVKLQDDPILKGHPGHADIMKRIPRFVRIGRSVLYPVLGKIKELQLLEQLVPATKLQKLTSGTIIGMRTSTGFDVQKGFEAARKAEDLLNQKVGVDTSRNQLTVENIMSTVGRMKVVPLFGEKGGLEKFDYKPEEPDDLLAAIEDIRRVICQSIGVPFEVIFGGDAAESKGELLKRYARYLRRLKAIQQAIADGLKQIIIIHLVNTQTDFNEKEDIQIEFRNKLIQVDLLDELEFLDTTVGMLGHVTDFLGINRELMSQVVNKKELLKFLKSKLAVLGMEKVIDESKAGDLDKKEDELDAATAGGGAPVPPQEEEPVEEPEPEPTGGGEQ